MPGSFLRKDIITGFDSDRDTSKSTGWGRNASSRSETIIMVGSELADCIKFSILPGYKNAKKNRM
jgi:hypothetical protein